MTMQGTSRLPTAAANGRNGHSLISDDKFRQLYALTLHLRALARDEDASAPWLRGSEAMLAAVAADLRASDVLVCPPAPSLRHELPRGVVVTVADRFDDSLTQVLNAAVAARLRKTGGIGVLFSAQHSRDPLLREACALAVRAKLPVLFIEHGISENTSPGSGNKSNEIDWMPAIPVDAQDVIAIYRVAHESITRARAGNGPTRIQCVPWVAPPNGRKSSGSGDAVEHLERWLIGRGLPAEQWRREITAPMEQNSSSAHQVSQQSADLPATNGSGNFTKRAPQRLA